MINIEHISKSFHGKPILKDVSLQINKGDVIALIGSSGAGKSTFLRSLNCLEKPDAGTMDIDGLHVDFKHITSKEKLQLRQKTAMVFQHFNLFTYRTALENIKEGLVVVKGMDDKTATEIAREKLKQVGLAKYENYYPKHLSGGMQQRIGIARALAMEPSLLLVDEPTSALDPELVGEVLNTLKQTAEAGQTLIIVSHEMRFVRDVATKVLFLDQGHIIEQGTPEEVFDHTKSERVKEFLNAHY